MYTLNSDPEMTTPMKATKHASRLSRMLEEFSIVKAEYPPIAPTRHLTDEADFEKKTSCFKRMTKCVGRWVAECKSKYKTYLNDKDVLPSASQEELLRWQPDQELQKLLAHSNSSSAGPGLNAKVDGALTERALVHDGPARVARWVDALDVEPRLTSMSARGGIVSTAGFWSLPAYSDTSTNSGKEDDQSLSDDRGEDGDDTEDVYTDWYNTMIKQRAEYLAEFEQAKLAAHGTGEAPVDQSLFADFDSSNVVTDSEGSSEYFYSRSQSSSLDSLTEPSEYGDCLGSLYSPGLQLWLQDRDRFYSGWHHLTRADHGADVGVAIASNELEYEGDIEPDTEIDLPKYTALVHTQGCSYDLHRKRIWH